MKKLLKIVMISTFMCGNILTTQAADKNDSNNIEAIITKIAEESGIPKETVNEDVYRTADIMQTDVNSAALYLLNEVIVNKVSGSISSKSSTYLGNGVPGDIFYTDSSTAGWNHGHTAIYYAYNKVVEAAKPGYNSRMVSTDNYIVNSGTDAQVVMVLDKNFGTTRNAYSGSAGIAAAKYQGRPYSLSLTNKTCSGAMNCSQLVWCAWNGYAEIDSTPGDGTVLPINILNSYQTKKVRTVI